MITEANHKFKPIFQIILQKSVITTHEIVREYVGNVVKICATELTRFQVNMSCMSEFVLFSHIQSRFWSEHEQLELNWTWTKHECFNWVFLNLFKSGGDFHKFREIFQFLNE